jgi:hypothetical protein
MKKLSIAIMRYFCQFRNFSDRAGDDSGKLPCRATSNTSIGIAP